MRVVVCWSDLETVNRRSNFPLQVPLLAPELAEARKRLIRAASRTSNSNTSTSPITLVPHSLALQRKGKVTQPFMEGRQTSKRSARFALKVTT